MKIKIVYSILLKFKALIQFSSIRKTFENIYNQNSVNGFKNFVKIFH